VAQARLPSAGFSLCSGRLYQLAHNLNPKRAVLTGRPFSFVTATILKPHFETTSAYVNPNVTLDNMPSWFYCPNTNSGASLN